MKKLLIFAFFVSLSGCASIGSRAGYMTSKRYYDGGQEEMIVSPLKIYGYNFMRGWEKHKLERARKAREDEK